MFQLNNNASLPKASNMPPPWDDDDDYVVPLESQQVFGAGIKRKRVPFVRASDDLQTTTASSSRQDGDAASATSVADRYFSIVMSKTKKQRGDNTEAEEVGKETSSSESSAPVLTNAKDSPSTSPTDSPPVKLCELCNLPLSPASPPEERETSEGLPTSAKPKDKSNTTPHEASIAHQVCLEHSHPPSHLDRTRHGLRYLASYGWDPDSRVGLGVAGRTGIREPIKPKAKNDTIGLGMGVDDEDLTAKQQKLRKQKQQQQQQKQQERRQKLNAKQVRGAYMADRKKGDQLRELFYGSDDIQRYLGGA